MATKTAYFFVVPDGVSRDNYAHNSLALAEGLRDLGWHIYANVDYWKNECSSEFLFQYDKHTKPSDCTVNVLSYDWMHYINVIPFELL